MIAIAGKMLTENLSRSISTIFGIAVAFFLSAAQFGMLVGWCHTNSAIVNNSGVDVWVMAKHTPAFDYGTDIPARRVYQTRTVPGVAWAQGMYMAWVYWQRPDGRRENTEMVGLDEDCVGGPWNMAEGSVSAVHIPERVIVDQLYLKDLGVEKIGDEVEISGRKAIVGAISRDVRTFTAAPWVFTSLESAMKYDRKLGQDNVTYVLVRCEKGFSAEQVRDLIVEHVPGVEALTTRQFAVRSVMYWMLETGVGITVVVTGVLGLLIGAAVISQALYATTNDHLHEYATLLAIGFSRFKLLMIIVIQAVWLGILGICVGSILFAYAVKGTATTPIPLETTPLIFSCIVATNLMCCVMASIVSIRSVFRIDPIAVFRA